jgi:membrane associated rhomboid family serine protease
MNGPSQVSFGFPKPGPALRAALIVLAAVGLLNAFLVSWVPSGAWLFEKLDFQLGAVSRWEVWRFVTSGLLTHPKSLNHLLFSLLGLYFLSPDMERRWGGARFLRFLLLATVMGNLFVTGVALLAGPTASEVFRPHEVFGPGAALAAVAVAWAREMPTAQIRLFFFLPVSSKALLWITLGFACLGLVYPDGIAEGVAAPFGGIVAGLLFAGSPSAVKALYLRFRLRSLERQANAAIKRGTDRPSGTGRRGPGAPPLRIVYGGLEEELKKRKPPKDKRYLN